MRAKIFCRLRSAAGETLVETMAAILIFTLSSILFLSMASAAARINTQARAADSAYQDQQRIAETGLSASGAALAGGTGRPAPDNRLPAIGTGLAFSPASPLRRVPCPIP